MTTAFAVPAGGTYEWPLVDDMADRFWPKVNVGADDQCWEWQAFINPSGYGMIRNGTRMALASRVAWVLEHGAVRPGLHVLHECDNRACVNVRHLYTGTNADNIRDKVRRGRSSFPNPWRRGEKHHNAKLTEADVLSIRARSTKTRGEGRAFALEYGVSEETIHYVLKGKVWKHLL